MSEALVASLSVISSFSVNTVYRLGEKNSFVFFYLRLTAGCS